MRTLHTALVALLLSTTVAHAAPRHRAHKHRAESRWMRDCITERTGPDGGIPVAEARQLCAAEQPEDEVAASKAALVLARLNAKVAKAKARAAKALEQCEQAVTDRCMELAESAPGRDCDTSAGLHAEYALVCLATPAAK